MLLAYHRSGGRISRKIRLPKCQSQRRGFIRRRSKLTNLAALAFPVWCLNFSCNQQADLTEELLSSFDDKVKGNWCLRNCLKTLCCNGLRRLCFGQERSSTEASNELDQAPIPVDTKIDTKNKSFFSKIFHGIVGVIKYRILNFTETTPANLRKLLIGRYDESDKAYWDRRSILQKFLRRPSLISHINEPQYQDVIVDAMKGKNGLRDVSFLFNEVPSFNPLGRCSFSFSSEALDQAAKDKSPINMARARLVIARADKTEWDPEYATGANAINKAMEIGSQLLLHKFKDGLKRQTVKDNLRKTLNSRLPESMRFDDAFGLHRTCYNLPPFLRKTRKYDRNYLVDFPKCFISPSIVQVEF